MTASDSESKLDEMERDNLQKMISDVETALAGSTPASRGLLEIFLQNAKGRVAVLDKKIKETEIQKENQARDMAALASEAQKETALSEREKETYSGFLKLDFFTKKDFDRLEQFYAHTWDRLSDSGKDEMSKRVWEGIRRDEYTFTELPKTVREKETERAYRRLVDSPTNASDLARIPTNDRNNFVHAYASGRREEAMQMLDRRSFRDNMFLGDSREIRHADSAMGKEADRNEIADKASTKSAKSEMPKASAMGELNLTSIDLSGMKAGGERAEISVGEIPRADDTQSRTR